MSPRSFATALKITNERLANGNVRETVRPGDAHAVNWPDPQNRPWHELETLCHRPTDDMRHEIHVDSTMWPRARWRHAACRHCDQEVNALRARQ